MSSNCLLTSMVLSLAVSETSFLSNDSHVELSLNTSHWSFGQSGSLSFRTRATEALLMYAGRKPGGGNSEFLLLDVTSGQARFSADLGSGIVFVSTVTHLYAKSHLLHVDYRYMSTGFTNVFQRIQTTLRQ